MSACRLGSTKNRTQIMRILQLIAHNDEGRLPSLGGQSEQILHLGVLFTRRYGDDALMVLCHSIQLTAVHFLNRDIHLTALGDNRANAALTVAARHQYAVQRTTGLQRFGNRVSACDIVFITFLLLFHNANLLNGRCTHS